MGELVCIFRAGTVVHFTHRECSLNPHFKEPSWDMTDLVPLDEMSHEVQCEVCCRPLAEEPPYLWSKMSHAEVNKAMREQQKASE